MVAAGIGHLPCEDPSLHPRGGLLASRRAGRRRGAGWGGPLPHRRDGRDVRAQPVAGHPHRGGDAAGDEAPPRDSPHDRAARAVHGRVHQGGRRSLDPPPGGDAESPPRDPAGASGRKAGGGGHQSGDPAGDGRGGGGEPGPPAPHDGEPRLRRAEVHPRGDAEADARAVAPCPAGAPLRARGGRWGGSRRPGRLPRPPGPMSWSPAPASSPTRVVRAPGCARSARR